MGQGIAKAAENGLYGSAAHRLADKVISHGLVGGLSSVAQGGPFRHGFLSAGAGALAAPWIHQNLTPGNHAAQITAAAVVSGTAAELGGGKFANGAITGAMGYAFNELSQKAFNKAIAKAAGKEWARIEALSVSEFIAEFNDHGLNLREGAYRIDLEIDIHKEFIRRQLLGITARGITADLGINVGQAMAEYAAAVASTRPGVLGLLGTLAGHALGMSTLLSWAAPAPPMRFTYDCLSGQCNVTGWVRR